MSHRGLDFRTQLSRYRMEVEERERGRRRREGKTGTSMESRRALVVKHGTALGLSFFLPSNQPDEANIPPPTEQRRQA